MKVHSRSMKVHSRFMKIHSRSMKIHSTAWACHVRRPAGASAVFDDHPRIAREKKTVEYMIRLYCSSHHPRGDGPCDQCAALLDYARSRLDGCPFGEHKPACSRCTTHCYGPDMRERIRTVMRYSGPRMLLRHPLLAIFHILDSLRKPPGSHERT